MICGVYVVNAGLLQSIATTTEKTIHWTVSMNITDLLSTVLIHPLRLMNGLNGLLAGSMAYAILDDNKRPRMANGFTLLKNGTPYLFGTEPFTDYEYWLGEAEVITKAA